MTSTNNELTTHSTPRTSTMKRNPSQLQPPPMTSRRRAGLARIPAFAGVTVAISLVAAAATVAPGCGEAADVPAIDALDTSSLEDIVGVGNCVGVTCAGNGQCVLEGLLPICVCDPGWAAPDCATCDEGFHADGDACVADAACAPDTCSGAGACSDDDGVVLCACEAGYAGPTCAACAEGYHRDGAAAGCVADEACPSGDGAACSGRGSCEDEGGVVVCQCEDGYAGDDCELCAAGFHEGEGDECELDERCRSTSCSGRGECTDDGGVVTCACDAGWAAPRCASCEPGFHGDPAVGCEPDELCADADPCSTGGTCVDAGGVTSCECAPGYTGALCEACYPGYHADTAGACVLDQKCLATSCSGAGDCAVVDGAVTCTCDAGTDGAACELCAEGFHADSGGGCAADETCAGDGDPCGGGGTCVDDTGVRVCECAPGWTGALCSQCYPGYHDDGGDPGACVRDETCLATSCSGAGGCDATGGVIVCACADGHAGPACEACDAGYHPDPGDPARCAPDEACSAAVCANGTCDDSTGAVSCVCAPGWAGAACDACAAGFHDEEGACVLDQTCFANTCAGAGACAADTGVVACACDAGYGGPFCEQCAVGHHRDAASGACAPDEACAAGSDPCGDHGTCYTPAGYIECACDAGWAGDTCAVCAAGYHPDPASPGECAVDEVCGAEGRGANGTCSVAGGVASCACSTGYGGVDCDECYAGYHDLGGACVLDETCLATTCAGRGACSLVDGVVSCECDPGYEGPSCGDCAAGYHRDGGPGGACVADEMCTFPDPCAPGGQCDDAGGVVRCACADGYAGPMCAQCAPGFHDVGAGACAADEVCVTGACSGTGACSIAEGVVTCACDPGYGGAACDECYPGYHDEGGACVLDDACQPGTCSGRGACTDDGGVLACACSAGYVGVGCVTCDEGFHPDAGACVADEACAGDGSTCSQRGQCAVVGGVAGCACFVGYAGPDCSACAAGHHPDGSGGCAPDEVCTVAACSGVGTCSVVDGLTACSCDSGYSGPDCEACYPGYHDDGGACVRDEVCLATTCRGRGVCSAADGGVQCACDAAYDGPDCGACAAGFHPDGSGGAGGCAADEACPGDGTACGPNGTCGVSGGVITCACDGGYGGPQCAQCAAGYHDEAGVCVIDEACAGDGSTCSFNGTCSVASGRVWCACDPGYDGPDCGGCYPGYHDEASACVLDEVCDQTSCSGHGACTTPGGRVSCVCDAGYMGADCSACDAGHHVDAASGSCVVDETCPIDGTACTGNGACDDSSGVAVCTCTGGFVGDLCEACPPGWAVSGETGTCVIPCGGGGGGNMLCDGRCVSVYDPDNCGACGNACAGAERCNAVQPGELPVCACPTEPQFADCGGVCTDIYANVENCGGCGAAACAPEEACLLGQCAANDPQCDVFFGGRGDGVCCPGPYCLESYSARNNPNNCGGCGITCDAGAGEACVFGQCAAGDSGDCGPPGSCGQSGLCCFEAQFGFGWCRESFELEGDPRHCGGCNIACAPNEQCADASCYCDVGSGDFADCGGVCTDVRGDAQNCGGCGVTCDAGAGEICAAGQCVTGDADCFDACSAGEICCAISEFPGIRCLGSDQLSRDPLACGACGVECLPGEACQGGECVCPAGNRICDGECVGFEDPRHCGGCAMACGGDEQCMDEGFGYQCRCPSEWGDPNYADCGGVCTEVGSSVDNCGGCGQVCAAPDLCAEGHCFTSNSVACEDFGGCSGGQVCCDEGGPGQCNWYFQLTDSSSCGGCGVQCAATESCESYTCTCPSEAGDSSFDRCGPGGECTELRADGNCGGCGVTCGAFEACESTTGEPTAPFACACPSDPPYDLCGPGAVCSNTDFDPTYCGGCGAPACNAGEACVQGACVPDDPTCGGCAGGELCCDDGGGPTCTGIIDDAQNCGACGNPCAANEVCDGGTCRCPTETGLIDCSGACVQPTFDDTHCGFCGNDCVAAGQRCLYGACQSDEEPTCGGCADDAFCCQSSCMPRASFGDDPFNCGACGVDCMSQGLECRDATCQCPLDDYEPNDAQPDAYPISLGLGEGFLASINMCPLDEDWFVISVDPGAFLWVNFCGGPSPINVEIVGEGPGGTGGGTCDSATQRDDGDGLMYVRITWAGPGVSFYDIEFMTEP